MSSVDSRTKICNPMLLADIFYTILDCFRPQYDQLERRALASLAQTCRAFSEPSLDRLWRKLDSLQPLFRCDAGAGDVENLIPLTSLQLAIIDRHSHRVRELIISEGSVHFLQYASVLPPLLFPNLRTLQWNPYSRPTHIPIILIQRLLSPTLVSLEATLSEEDGPMLVSFFDDYPLLCRNLKSIRFHFLDGAQLSETTIHGISRAIYRQDILENVIINAPIDDVALKHLSTLPTLRALSVNLSETSRPQSHTCLPADPVFCGVEKLGFVTSNLELVTSLLRPGDQIFHSFSLHYQDRLTSEATINFLNVLASRSQTKPLRKLTLSCGDFSNPLPVDLMAVEAPRYRLTYETLEPLMVFGSLRYLTIEWSEQISLDDDELVKLAHCWPLLQVFNFYCGRGGYPPFSAKYPTLRGLLSLVTACPELYAVSLPLDATQVPEVEEAEACETNFACLTVPESPIDEARPVAEFLCRYLPCVTAVDARFLRLRGANVPQITAYELAWQQVEIQLGELRGLLSDSDSVRSWNTDDDD